MNPLSRAGNISTMRLLALLCLAISGFIAIYSVINNRDLSSTAILCSVFLSAGVGGKVAEKHLETRNIMAEEPINGPEVR